MDKRRGKNDDLRANVVLGQMKTHVGPVIWTPEQNKRINALLDAAPTNDTPQPVGGTAAPNPYAPTPSTTTKGTLQTGKRIEKPLRIVDAAIDKVLRGIYEYGPPKPERPTESTVIYRPRNGYSGTITARELDEGVVELSLDPPAKSRFRFAHMTAEESEAIISNPNEWGDPPYPSKPEAWKRERLAETIAEQTNRYQEILKEYEQIVRALEIEIDQLTAPASMKRLVSNFDPTTGKTTLQDENGGPVTAVDVTLPGEPVELRWAGWPVVVAPTLMPIAPSGPAAKPSPTASGARQNGGRPRILDDEWARVEYHDKHRPKMEVYKEWVVRPTVRDRNLSKPLDSFEKMIKTKPKIRGRNE